MAPPTQPRFLSRTWRRRLALGLPTILGLRPRGWFIPHRHADEAPAPAGYAALQPLFQAAEPAFRAWLAGLAPVAADFAAIAAAPGGQGGARWNQSWFPRLDAASAYAMVRLRQPRLILEIGSGHSTRFLLQAVADGGLASEVVAIDPAPRADLAGRPLTLLRTTLQRAGLEPFQRLRPGDLLLIDSSHILMPGSDVDLLFAEVLPRLPAGVFVQVHDVFLPDGYPAIWGWRGYNEQQGLVGWLASGRLGLRFASHYAATRLAEAVAASAVGPLPLLAEAFENALWMETMPAAGLPPGGAAR